MTLGMINKAKDDFNHQSRSAQLPLNFFVLLISPHHKLKVMILLINYY